MTTARSVDFFAVADSFSNTILHEKFDSTRQTVSNHIKVLQECGLVTSKQKGREIYYQIHPKKLKAVADWLEPFQKMWEEKLDNFENYVIKLKNKK